ncbi:MAG: L-alanine-DL-glutamate epimerase [Chitinophagaceae bacterium]|nr:L-alanine-DL-glutamate epimerase [Chitinophagaceae bacterium]
MNRREFMNYTGGMMSLGVGGIQPNFNKMETFMQAPSPIRIKDVDSNFERESLRPYRFKGGAITEAWQTAAMLESDSGNKVVGLGCQSVLWSDSKVAADHTFNGGNALMFAMSERALQMMKGQTFKDPNELLDRLLPEVLEYGKKITGNPNLRKTFALNALVCVDNAAWILYARENKLKTFDDLIPAAYKPGLSFRHSKVGSMPAFSVGADVNKLKKAAEEGYFIMKLKIGSAGTQKEMLAKDIEFLTAVHKAIGHYETPYTRSGKIPYYFDANERYDEKDTLLRFLDHAKKIGALDQISSIEEPFGERNQNSVKDIDMILAADESAHTVEDAAARIEQGYRGIAVKAVAKTLSMTMRITQLAHEKNIPCFCADLTVNPILVDWNKAVAARLAPFPQLNIGLQETNGHQYYIEWDRMMSYHPRAGAPWTITKNGVYETGKEFYEQSGGILEESKHYLEVFRQPEI